jgi:UDP-N-acetylglucosamine 2-epimerase (non-hydrolysing)
VVYLGKVLVVFGTRPEAIKMAPVIRELKQVQDIETQVLVTAQHREMLDQVLHLFAIEPDHDLDLMREGQDLYSITTGVLNGVREVLEKERPELVVVHGDTTTTFAASLAAFYQRIPVAHVEAGLRTYNKYSPFPEEINRSLTARLADLHFAPTDLNRDNLLRESIGDLKIWVTGNTVIDALMQTIRPGFDFGPELAQVDFNRRIILLTTHRRENWGGRMGQIYLAMLDLSGPIFAAGYQDPALPNLAENPNALKQPPGFGLVHHEAPGLFFGAQVPGTSAAIKLLLSL